MSALRVAVVGDAACGKTCLCTTYTENVFPNGYVPTKFNTIYRGTITVGEKTLQLKLCDTTADYSGRSCVIYHPHTDVFLICFSIADPDSLSNILHKWVPEVKSYDPRACFLLVATKCDLLENIPGKNQTFVSSEDGRAMAKTTGAWDYMECSALSHEGLDNVYEKAARAALQDSRRKQFDMKSLVSLEKMAGIDIVTPLAEQYWTVAIEIKVPFSKPQLKKLGAYKKNSDRLEYVIDTWKHSGRKTDWPCTWRSLSLLLQKMGLEDLQCQINDYIGKAGYLSTYHHVLSTHEVIEMWFIKVILLGAPRLGKTTVRRRLTGEIRNISSSGEPEQSSTGVVESAPSVVIRNLFTNTALVTQTEWRAAKDLTEEACMLIQFFHSYVKTTEGTPTNIDMKKVLQSFQKKSSGFSKKAKKRDVQSVVESPTSAQPRKSRPQGMEEAAELFRNAVDPKCWKDIQHAFKDSAFLKMEDTGGQPEFMDMLPALTIGPALYFLFCKLTDELKSHYTVCYLDPSGESTKPEKSTYTIEEVLLTALSSISCFKSNSSTPPVSSSKPYNSEEPISSLAYIVGTHKDKVSEMQLDEFDTKLQESIRSTDFFKEGLVQFSSEDRMVIPIDNMDGDENEIRRIQKLLEEGMKKHFKKVRIPATWLVLSLCLRKREERTASLQSVLQFAKELGIPSKEVKPALQFLHHYAGVLMFFPELEELKDTVICDTQIVYDSATHLIVNTFKFGKVGKPAAERFRETGQFSMETIKGATEKFTGDYIPIQKLVKLLEYLNIIAPISSNAKSEVMYFMPCILQNLTHEALDQCWGSVSNPLSPAPLFIRYKCGYVPIGVFPAMIATLVNSKLLHMIEDDIKKNRVRYYFGSDYDTVTLISHPKYYAVHLTRQPTAKTPTHKVCSHVRELVESTLKNVTSRMNYSFQMEYQLGFECPTHPGRDHLCIVEGQNDSLHFMLCLKSLKKPEPKEMQNCHLVWFKMVPAPSADTSSFHTAPTVQEFISSLPPCARPHLELELDHEHEGVDEDLCEIADHMIHWVEKISIPLGLTEVDISDITEGIKGPVLQRREALRIWKRKQGRRATYWNLLEVFIKAGQTQCAEALCGTLRKKYCAHSCDKTYGPY